MIFAFETDDNSLHVFSSEEKAISYCEGIDVENGIWLFFAKNGMPLKAVFSIPPKKGWLGITSGKYRLEESAGPNLEEILDRVKVVNGMGMRSVDDVIHLIE